MKVGPVQAAIYAVVVQAGALAVGYGLVNNLAVGKWIALTMAIVTLGGLITHGLHGAAAQLANPPQRPPAAALSNAPAPAPPEGA